MDLLKLLTYEEKIGGLAVFDSRIEALVLDFDEKKGALSIKTSASVDLPSKTVEGGILKNKESFVAAAKSLLEKIKEEIKISSFIVSLPADAIYSKNFSFPRTLTDAQIDESMKLNLSFSLPFSPESAYLDWETIESSDIAKKELILCAVDRKVIDGYLEAFSESGITPVAIEFHNLSASRVVVLKSKEPALVVTLLNDNLELSIIESGAIRFLQAFDINKILSAEAGKNAEDIVIDKIWRAVNFYNSEKNQKGYLNKIYLIGDYEKTAKYKDIISQKIEGVQAGFPELLPAFPKLPMSENSNLPDITFGSALRGLMPRREDTIISLMPMGTEQAYEQKRLVSFVKLASDLVSVLSIFFVAMFIGSWILVEVLENNIEKSLSGRGALPEGLLELKSRADNFNKIISQAEGLSGQAPKWSGFSERISALGVYGISLNRIDTSLDGSVNIAGVASTRDSLLQFKDVLEKSNLFLEVKIPFNYLEQKDNISFALALKLKDSSILFNQ